MTGKGERPLMVEAWDEMGNKMVGLLDLRSLNEFHGRTTAASTSNQGSG